MENKTKLNKMIETVSIPDLVGSFIEQIEKAIDNCKKIRVSIPDLVGSFIEHN